MAEEYNLKAYERGLKEIIKPPELEKNDLFVIDEITYQNEKDYLMKILLFTVFVVLLLLVV